MAEQALYDNANEPLFPFEAVRSRLSWLSVYLNDHITCPPYDMEPFLNTILVFGRARTATLQGQFWWNELNELTRRLNSTLEAVNASHHKLELVPRGESFFVTCSRSPGFDWKVQLTHGDVGRNLDFFAPGHLSPTEPKCFVQFIEVGSMQITMAEAVLIDAFKDDLVRDAFQLFNERRESLFNTTMKELGLPYRFKYVVTFPCRMSSVPRIMSNVLPPSASWWEDNCVYVNGYFLSGTVMDSRFAFCGFDTKFDVYWPLMTMMFDFVVKYGQSEYWYTSEETGIVFWKSFESICHRVKSKCDHYQSAEEADEFVDEIKQELKVLAEQADKPNKTKYKGEFRPDLPPRFKKNIPKWLRRLQYTKFKIIWARELVRMYLFEHRKLNNHLVRRGPDSPAAADEPAFRHLP